MLLLLLMYLKKKINGFTDLCEDNLDVLQT